jgi:hypothetical protein
MLIQSTYIKITSKRSLQSYAGVNLVTYKKLRSELELIENERLSALANRENRLRQFGGGGKQLLPTIDDKLLFILNYFKSYPTMDIMATNYDISRATVWNYVHALSGKLHNILVKLDVMPMREMPTIEAFKAYLEANKIHQLIIDVTERTIERPSKKEENRAQYSGKKKRHTVKNTLITDLKRMIIFLGLTTAGAIHDYFLLKEELRWFENEESWFDCIELFVDLGYLGIGDDFDIEKLNIPIKKPPKSKNNPDPQLTDEQKEHNKTVSKTRVRIEHAIGSMKIFNIMAHIYRNHRKDFEDMSAGICAAIHNLKLKLN